MPRGTGALGHGGGGGRGGGMGRGVRIDASFPVLFFSVLNSLPAYRDTLFNH